MPRRLFFDVFGGNTICALASGTKLLEYHIEKNSKPRVVGSIYKGKVENVLVGMNAAFVDVGLDKNGYLFAPDSLIDKSSLDNIEQLPSELNVKEGDVIMVQAVKDPVGTKGVRLTTNVSFAGRYSVYAPMLEGVSVSRKITCEKSREKLVKILNSVKREQGGFIARTASENASSSEIKREAKQLIAQYKETLLAYETAEVCSPVFSDGDLVMRMLRDLNVDIIEKIIVADRDLYEKLKALPKSRDKVKRKLEYFSLREDVFKHYGLTGEIESLLRSKVELSSGAYLIIDKTEALTVIDVNTGSYVGEDALENTAYKTNVLAAEEIARQVRLRNIGGIVIVDFIDMQDEEHRNSLVKVLENALAQDRFKCNVVGMTGLGIVEFTRKKKRKSVTSVLNRPCPYCKGEGRLFSNDYIVMKLRTALLDLFSEDYTSAIIDLNVEVCSFVLETGSLSRDVKKFWADKRIYLVPHKTYHHEHFTVRGDREKVLELPDNAQLLY